MSFFSRNQGAKVNFIIGGTQKGGTTALDKYLRGHHDLLMASIKEVHFFDTESFFGVNPVDYSANPDFFC
jgi:hypothetical protein